LSVEPLKRTVRRVHSPNKSNFILLHSLFARHLSALGAALLLASACATPPPSDASRLTEYGPEDASLLDDGFSGHLFETAFVPGTAGDDPRFDDRVRAAHGIWLVKVATISREGSLAREGNLGDKRRYEVTFRTLGVLAGPAAPPQVSLTISAKDPSFHWLDRVGGAWVGRELLLMTRNYRKDEASPTGVMHFHGEPNTPELQARIRAVRASASAAERGAHAPKK
jgi:hypothetical protein